MESIENPRLLNFELKSLLYRFKAIHVPGNKHAIPDAFSRRNDAYAKHSVGTAGYADSLGPPVWVSTPVVLAISADVDELLQGYIIASLALVTNSKITVDGTLDIITW